MMLSAPRPTHRPDGTFSCTTLEQRERVLPPARPCQPLHDSPVLAHPRLAPEHRWPQPSRHSTSRQERGTGTGAVDRLDGDLMVTVRVTSTLRVYGRSGDTVHIAPGHGRTSARRRMRTSVSLHTPTTARNKSQHKYSTSTQKPTSPIPANHNTTSTTATGSSKNHSYARTILPLRMRTPRSSYTLLPNGLACVGPTERNRPCTSDVTVP